MGAYNHWWVGLARAAAAVALATLWHGQALAACDSDIVESMVLAMEAPATEHSAPCCAVAPSPAVASQGVRAGTGYLPAAAISGRDPRDDSAATRLPDPRPPDHPWRRYCARCARLLR